MTTFTVVTGREPYKVVDCTTGCEAYFQEKLDAYKRMALLVELGRPYRLEIDYTRRTP